LGIDGHVHLGNLGIHASRSVHAQTYGFAPSLIVPVSQPIIYQALSANPDAVAAVKTVSLVPRSGEYPGQLFDSLA
jgi:hypothetical protein